jgi:hypothetical protein
LYLKLTKPAAIAGGGLNWRGKIHGHGVCAGEQCGGDKNTSAAKSEREFINRKEHGNFLNRRINKAQQGVFLLWSEIQSKSRSILKICKIYVISFAMKRVESRESTDGEIAVQ